MSNGIREGNIEGLYIINATINPSAINEYVTNGTFASDTGWTKGAGWTIAAGVADAAGALSTAISQTAAFTLQEGSVYSVTFTTTRAAGSIAVTLGGGTAGASISSSTTTTQLITAGSTQIIAFTGTGFTGTLDTITINDSVGEQTFTVPGVRLGDAVFATKPTITAGMGVCTARVSAMNTVAIQFINPTAAVIDPSSETWTIFVARPELNNVTKLGA